MRSMIDMDHIQLEVTNVCRLNCSNCSRFCGHHKNPYFMDLDFFKKAVDSMEGYPRVVGFQGGEPLLHPQFERMCEYARSKFSKKRLGLWTTLPEGFEKYREIICETFYHIFINDHTRNDIFHHPGLVAIEEVITDKNNMWQCIDHCWAQMSWSASINPKGAFFCEIAASMSILFEEEGGWKVEPGWWNRIPKDFTAQMEQYCPRCGFAAPVSRRASIEGIDDISPRNFVRLRGKSFKLAKGDYKISNLKIEPNPQPLAAYKDFNYRDRIANRYGMFLFINESNTWTPCLKNDFDLEAPKKSLFETYKERFS